MHGVYVPITFTNNTVSEDTISVFNKRVLRHLSITYFPCTNKAKITYPFKSHTDSLIPSHHSQQNMLTQSLLVTLKTSLMSH